MRIALVFDTPHAGWDDADFKAAVQEQQKNHDLEPEAEFEIAEALMAYGHDVFMVGVSDDVHLMLERLRGFGPELVFNCSEGFRGHAGLDYLFPALLESEGFHYTGSPPLSLLVTRNKAMSKKILVHHGLCVPAFTTYRPGERVNGLPAPLDYPLIVKPLLEDASEGISRASVVTNRQELAERVAFVHERYSQPAIAEQFIDGRELYAGVIGNDGNVEVLPLTELVFDKNATKPQERIATKHAKWHQPYRERRGIRNVFARPVSRDAKERVTEACRVAMDALWLRDYARLDVRLTPDDKVYVLEANANPFLSFGHDMANAAEKAGMDFYAFIQRIVDEAAARYARAG